MSVRLTFNTSTLDAPAEDITVKFDNPIYLGDGLWEIALVRLFTYNAQFNITSEKENNQFSYSLIGSPTLYNNIDLIDGNYTIEDISNVIGTKMIANGHPAITITPDYATGLNILQVDPTQIANMDFKDSTNPRNLRHLLGFNSRTVSNNSGDPIYSDFIGDINAGIVAWIVECSLVEGSYSNGSSSQVLFTFVPGTPPFGALFCEPINLSYTKISKNVISEIRLRLTDQNGNRLNLNGENIVYELHVRRKT